MSSIDRVDSRSRLDLLFEVCVLPFIVSISLPSLVDDEASDAAKDKNHNDDNNPENGTLLGGGDEARVETIGLDFLELTFGPIVSGHLGEANSQV